jgi:hypothetical protein
MANKKSVGRTRLLPELCQYAEAILCPERTNIILYLKSSIVTVGTALNLSGISKNQQDLVSPSILEIFSQSVLTCHHKPE